MDLSRKQILELQPALKRLDTFKLSGKTRMQIAPRIRRVNEAVEDITTAQKGMAAQHELTGNIKVVEGQQLPVDDPAKTRQYNLEWAAQLSEVLDYTVGKFLLADLDLTTNNLSIGTLAALLPIISDLPKIESRSVTLKRSEALAVGQALARIDTADNALKMPYARKLALADLLSRLSRDADKLEIDRQALIDKLGLAKYRQNAAGYWESADEPAPVKVYNEKWLEIMKAPQPLTVPVMASTELDLDTNNIPGSLLADLLPILNEPAEAQAAAAAG